jgi:hypothetical protein
MARPIDQGNFMKPTWECKQCHQHISDDCNVAYHLIDGILYGWCEPCFSQRGDVNNKIAA